MRLLRRIAILAVLVWATLWSLANFVDPVSRDMEIAIPVDAAK